jgi:hypothetical protein
MIAILKTMNFFQKQHNILSLAAFCGKALGPSGQMIRMIRIIIIIRIRGIIIIPSFLV